MKLKHICYLLGLAFLMGCGEETINTGQSEAFIKFFGNSLMDEGSDVKQLSDGGYIITGTSTTGYGDTDVVLIRTDEYGNEQWSVYFGGQGDDQGTCVEVAGDGGFIMTGSYYDIQRGDLDLYLIKANNNGTLQWEKFIGGNGNQVGNSVQELDDGFVIAGTTDQFGNDDILVVRTTTSGEILDDDDSWYATRGYGITDEGNHIIEVPGRDGFIVIGTTSLEDPGRGLLNSNIITIYVTGNGVGWSNMIFGGGGNDPGECIQHIQDNEFIMTGTLDVGPNSKMFIQKMQFINEDISKVWANPASFIESTGRSTGKFAQVTTDGGFAVLGSVIASPGNSDFYLVLTDEAGATLYGETFTFGGTGNEFGMALQQTIDGGFIMVGSTGIPEDDNRMIALIKTNGEGKLN